MQIRIEALGIRAFEFFQKFLLVAALEDVMADVIRFGQVEDDEIMSAAIGAGLGAGGLGFLVPRLAVDDAGDAFLGILPDAFPDAHHVAAGGVHEHAALFFESFARADLGAKRGNHHDIAGIQARHFLLGRLGRDDLDAHVADLIVDLRVVDDFAEQINGLVRGEIFPRGIGEVDRALDAVAETEFLRELDGEAVGGEHAAVGADAFDEFAAVVGEHLGLHGLENIGPAEVDFFLRGGRFG